MTKENNSLHIPCTSEFKKRVIAAAAKSDRKLSDFCRHILKREIEFMEQDIDIVKMLRNALASTDNDKNE